MHLIVRTGYLKNVAKYKDPVQSSAAIKRGQEGADGVDLGGKVKCCTRVFGTIHRCEALLVSHRFGILIFLVMRNDMLRLS